MEIGFFFLVVTVVVVVDDVLNSFNGHWKWNFHFFLIENVCKRKKRKSIWAKNNITGTLNQCLILVITKTSPGSTHTHTHTYLNVTKKNGSNMKTRNKWSSLWIELTTKKKQNLPMIQIYKKLCWKKITEDEFFLKLFLASPILLLAGGQNN